MPVNDDSKLAAEALTFTEGEQCQRELHGPDCAELALARALESGEKVIVPKALVEPGAGLAMDEKARIEVWLCERPGIWRPGETAAQAIVRLLDAYEAVAKASWPHMPEYDCRECSPYTCRLKSALAQLEAVRKVP